METNVKILKTIKSRLDKAASSASAYHSNSTGYSDEIKKLRNEMQYSVDMLDTIIKIETGEDEPERKLLPE